MYNGIGLKTVRGSGTNGYVQRNLSYVRPDRLRNSSLRNSANNEWDKYGNSTKSSSGMFKKPNDEILQHEKKREIELKIFEMRDAMEERGHTEDEIIEKEHELRKKLEDEFEKNVKNASKNYQETQSHLQAVEKEHRNDKMKNAFGIQEGFVPGEAFDREVQERKKGERLAEREKRDKEFRSKRREEEKRRKLLDPDARPDERQPIDRHRYDRHPRNNELRLDSRDKRRSSRSPKERNGRERKSGEMQDYARRSGDNRRSRSKSRSRDDRRTSVRDRRDQKRKSRRSPSSSSSSSSSDSSSSGSSSSSSGSSSSSSGSSSSGSDSSRSSSRSNSRSRSRSKSSR